MVIAVVDLLAIVPRGTYYSAARYNEGGGENEVPYDLDPPVALW